MRLLVAGRNAQALARAAGAFADDLTIETAASKVAAIALLERAQFDLILACEKLDDGSGLEVLSHAVVNAPDTLRIFAARPVTLNLLKGELGLFGLFRTLPYPINFRKVWAAIDLVRSCCVESELPPQPRNPTPRVPHVVLDSAWEAHTPGPVVLQPDAASPRPTAPVDVSPSPRPPTRIPESEAFKRALARRNEAKRRGDPSVNNELLGQLTQLVTKRPPTRHSPASVERWKRTALLAGAAVAAASIAAVLTFFLLSGKHSSGRPVLARVVSSERLASEKPPAFVPRATAAPATADMDAEAKAGLVPPPGPSAPKSYDESGRPVEQ